MARSIHPERRRAASLFVTAMLLTAMLGLYSPKPAHAGSVVSILSKGDVCVLVVNGTNCYAPAQDAKQVAISVNNGDLIVSTGGECVNDMNNHLQFFSLGIADSQGNSYTIRSVLYSAACGSVGSAYFQMWTTTATATGTDTVTVTAINTCTVSCVGGAQLYEFDAMAADISGISASGAVYKNQYSAIQTPITSAGFSPPAGAFLFGSGAGFNGGLACSNGGTTTPGTGLTQHLGRCESISEYCDGCANPGTWATYSENQGFWFVFAGFGNPDTFVLQACTFFQLQCWWYPFLFMMVYSGFLVMVGATRRVSPNGMTHLFITGLTYGSLIAVILGIMNIVFPLMLLTLNTLYVLRFKR